MPQPPNQKDGVDWVHMLLEELSIERRELVIYLEARHRTLVSRFVDFDYFGTVGNSAPHIQAITPLAATPAGVSAAILPKDAGVLAASEKPFEIAPRCGQSAAPHRAARQAAHWISYEEPFVEKDGSGLPAEELGNDVVLPVKVVADLMGGSKSFRISSKKGGKFEGWLTFIVTSPAFEAFFIILIVLNAAAMAVEVQHGGYKLGVDLGYPRLEDRAQGAPGLGKTMATFQEVLGVLFTLEVFLKMLGMQVRFLQSFWNIFDTFLVVLWLASTLGNVNIFLDPFVLRLLRLARVIRLVRLASKMHAISSLQLIISSILSSKFILFWTVCILLLVMMVFSLSLNFMLQGFMGDTDIDEESRRRVYKYFGTFSRAILTMCEITIANWVPACRTLAEEVNEAYGYLILLYVTCISFGVVKVVTGIFLQETFSVAASDDELMIARATRESQKHVRKMKMLFDECDASHNNRISLAEFQEFMLDPRVKAWLKAMDVSVDNVVTLFNLIDSGGDHQVSIEELVQGISKLKGSARGVDMAVLMQLTTHITERMDATDVAEELGQLKAEMRAIHHEVAGMRQIRTALRETSQGERPSPISSIPSRASVGRSSAGCSPGSLPPAPRPLGDKPAEISRKIGARLGETFPHDRLGRTQKLAVHTPPATVSASFEDALRVAVESPANGPGFGESSSV